VYMQERRADGFPECVAFYQGGHWWIATIPGRPGQPSQRGLPKWLAKGTRRLVAHPICDMLQLAWRLPAGCPRQQMHMRVVPNRDAEHLAYEGAAANYEAEAAGLKAELAELLAKNTALQAENQMLKGQDWGGVPDPGPEDYAGTSSTQTWSDAEWLDWRRSRHPSTTKTGWMNKCVALLAALHVDNQQRINHLCNTPLSCVIMSSCCIVICINTCDV
jgi:hypothetical protein